MALRDIVILKGQYSGHFDGNSGLGVHEKHKNADFARITAPVSAKGCG